MSREFSNNGNIHFKKWLTKHGFTLNSFSRSFEDGEVRIDTIKKWVSGDATPGDMLAKVILAKYPKCPILKDYLKKIYNQKKAKNK